MVSAATRQPLMLARGLIDGRVTCGEVREGRLHPFDGDVFAPGDRRGPDVPLTEVRLLCPITPGTMLMTMGGFVGSGGPVLDEVPWLVPKLASPVSGDDGTIVIPPFVTTLWIEVELAAVIGREVRNASNEEAADCIFGYTCFNDASAPQFFLSDIRRLTPAPVLDIWRTKSLATFASMGPWIRTDLTSHDIQAGLTITARVNGELKSRGTTRDLKFSPANVVAFASRHVTLRRGDVISLGTPQPCEAQAGDRVDLEIEGIGVLRNQVVALVEH